MPKKSGKKKTGTGTYADDMWDKLSPSVKEMLLKDAMTKTTDRAKGGLQTKKKAGMAYGGMKDKIHKDTVHKSNAKPIAGIKLMRGGYMKGKRGM